MATLGNELRISKIIVCNLKSKFILTLLKICAIPNQNTSTFVNIDGLWQYSAEASQAPRGPRRPECPTGRTSPGTSRRSTAPSTARCRTDSSLASSLPSALETRYFGSTSEGSCRIYRNSVQT